MTTKEREGLIAPATALVTWLLIDVLRVWLPALLLGTDLLAVARGGLALVIAAVGPLLVALTPASRRREVWLAAVATLLLARLGLQFDVGGTLLVVLASLALVGATVALGLAVAVTRTATTVRFSAVAGVGAAAIAHAGLAMTDLVWRTGPAAWIATAVLLAATAYSAWMTPIEDPDDEVGSARWPWWLLAPALLLLQVLVFVPGRVAAATRWSDPLVAATVIVAAGLLVAAVLVGRRIGHAVAGPAGAGLVLVGTAGSLEPSSVVSVVAQLALAAGLGLVIAACDRVEGSPTPRQRSVAAASIPLLACTLAFLYYLGYGFVLPFQNRMILLLVGVMVAVGGLWAGAARDRQVLRERGMLRRVARGALITVALATLAAATVGGADRGPVSPGDPDEAVRVAQVNLHLGFDEEGRFAVHRIADALGEHDPDIVVLNGVDRGWMTTGGHDILRQLSGQLGLAYVFGPAADEVTGNAVLSRYPVTETSVERLPRGQDPLTRSNLIAVVEVAPEVQVAVLATELSDVDQQGDTRLPQIRAIAATLARLQDRGVPVIVAGSLHAEPDEPELTTLAETATSVLPSGSATWPASDPQRHLDHLLTTEGIRVRGATVLDLEITPHRPVVADLEILPGPPEDDENP